MFDFLSYVRDSGMEIKILPPGDGILIVIEIRDPETGFFEQHSITDSEAKRCGNIDAYTGRILDGMAARIGSRKAVDYSAKHQSRQLRERENFFRGK